MLVRIPMISEVKNVVRYADISLNSDLDVIAAISDAAMALGKKHGVVLMVEMGDLREGFMLDEMMDVVEKVVQLPGVWLTGMWRQFQLLWRHHSGAFTAPRSWQIWRNPSEANLLFVSPLCRGATPVRFIC